MIAQSESSKCFMWFKRVLHIIAVVTALPLLNACSQDKTDPFIGYSADYIYAVGHDALQNGKWSTALEAYQSLDSQYPFNSYTQKGDLDSIYANYRNNDSALALTKPHVISKCTRPTPLALLMPIT